MGKLVLMHMPVTAHHGHAKLRNTFDESRAPGSLPGTQESCSPDDAVLAAMGDHHDCASKAGPVPPAQNDAEKKKGSH